MILVTMIIDEKLVGPIDEKAIFQEKLAEEQPKHHVLPFNGSKVLQVQLLSLKAKEPKRSSELAAGYDLFASESILISPNQSAIVPTDIAIAVPEGHYGRIAPRSSLAAKHGLDVGAGVVDADYRGPLSVVLFNHRGQSYQINQGDRIAQLILQKISTPDLEVVDQLPRTKRDQGGFGSTGK